VKRHVLVAAVLACAAAAGVLLRDTIVSHVPRAQAFVLPLVNALQETTRVRRVYHASHYQPPNGRAAGINTTAGNVFVVEYLNETEAKEGSAAWAFAKPPVFLTFDGATLIGTDSAELDAVVKRFVSSHHTGI
jgi:hypothetical protein